MSFSPHCSVRQFPSFKRGGTVGSEMKFWGASLISTRPSIQDSKEKFGHEKFLVTYHQHIWPSPRFLVSEHWGSLNSVMWLSYFREAVAAKPRERSLQMAPEHKFPEKWMYLSAFCCCYKITETEWLIARFILVVCSGIWRNWRWGGCIKGDVHMLYPTIWRENRKSSWEERKQQQFPGWGSYPSERRLIFHKSGVSFPKHLPLGPALCPQHYCSDAKPQGAACWGRTTLKTCSNHNSQHRGQWPPLLSDPCFASLVTSRNNITRRRRLFQSPVSLSKQQWGMA